MLVSLSIRNTAIIDRLTVDFKPGLNCLTGETGAGKSIIIDSICCLLGERVSKENIRSGCDTASVQGVFCFESEEIRSLLDELGVEAEEDGTVILYREYNISGKNICRVNGTAVTLSMFRKVGELLVDVHGQHDNHSLLSVSSHIGLLDLFAGETMKNLKTQYCALLSDFKNVSEEIESLSGDPAARAREADMLEYQINEIESASLKEGEEEKLTKYLSVLQNGEKISNSLNNAYRIICGDSSFYSSKELSCVEDYLKKAISEMESISEFDESYRQIAKSLNDAYYTIEDAGETLREEKDNDVFSPQELSETESRLNLIYSLENKYGKTILDILLFLQESKEKLDRQRGSDERFASLLKIKKDLSGKLLAICEDMNFERKKAAKLLEKSICDNLAEMEMKKVLFSVNIEFCGDETENGFPKFTKNGLDLVEFLVSANPGEPLRSLSKIASGGELSRIMLSIKSSLADVDGIPVLIFDEIDSGISGKAAVSVGRKFRRLSRGHQVICVSHLAQIAAIAESNIYVSKSVSDDGASTRTTAVNLTDDEKVAEICRLLDGEAVTDATVNHAKELIERLNQIEH